MAGATGVFWIDDRRSATRSGVVTALAPAKGLPAQRDFVQFTLLQSAQGLAVDPKVDDLAVAFNGDIVTLSRPPGLTLSSINAKLDERRRWMRRRPPCSPA